jgi:hypothetical protein
VTALNKPSSEIAELKMSATHRQNKTCKVFVTFLYRGNYSLKHKIIFYSPIIDYNYKIKLIRYDSMSFKYHNMLKVNPPEASKILPSFSFYNGARKFHDGCVYNNIKNVFPVEIQTIMI